MYSWICVYSNLSESWIWMDELHKQESCCYFTLMYSQNGLSKLCHSVYFALKGKQVGFAVTVAKKCLNWPLMCDHVIELGTESLGMCFGAAADETMWEMKSVVSWCAAREKTSRAAVTSHYRSSTMESSMGIWGSEQWMCLNVGGVSKGFWTRSYGFCHLI